MQPFNILQGIQKIPLIDIKIKNIHEFNVLRLNL
jgi:hypothetical protein